MLFKQHFYSSPLNSTHYAMLYPQNSDRIAAVDFVTSFRPMYLCAACLLFCVVLPTRRINAFTMILRVRLVVRRVVDTLLTILSRRGRTDGRTGEARGRRRSTDRSPGPSTAGRVPGPSPGPRRPRPRRPSTEDDLITGGRLLLGGRAPRRLEMTAELTTRRLAWTFAAKEDRGVRTSRDPSASSSSTTARD